MGDNGSKDSLIPHMTKVERSNPSKDEPASE